MKLKETENHIHLLISKNLKRLRKTLNVSQMNISEKADLSANFINEIENCKKGTSLKTIAKLCTALNVEPYEFFLPEDMTNDLTGIYISDIRKKILKAVAEVTNTYIRETKK